MNWSSIVSGRLNHGWTYSVLSWFFAFFMLVYSILFVTGIEVEQSKSTRSYYKSAFRFFLFGFSCILYAFFIHYGLKMFQSMRVIQKEASSLSSSQMRNIKKFRRLMATSSFVGIVSLGMMIFYQSDKKRDAWLFFFISVFSSILQFCLAIVLQ